MSGYECTASSLTIAQPFKDFRLFSEFPPEIQRLIFEEAFEESSRKAIQLALVSREVRSWIEPLMYQRIVLNYHYPNSSPARFDLFSDTFYHGTKPKSFYANVVQQISIDNLLLHNLAEKFIPLCSNATRLTLWEDPIPNSQKIVGLILSPNAFPRLQRLSIIPDSLPPSHRTYHHPIFKHLTHLDIICRDHFPWDGLRSLENLTHLSLNFTWDYFNAKPLRSVIQIAFPNFPSNLQCIVILVSVCILYSLAYRPSRCDDESRQFFDDVIQGKHYPGEVLGVLNGVTNNVKRLLAEGFVRYIVPVNIDFSACKDFWMEADEMIEKRKRDQASRSNEENRIPSCGS